MKTIVVFDEQRVDIYRDENGRIVIRTNALPIVQLYDCGVEGYTLGEAQYDIKELHSTAVENQLLTWRANNGL